jgi:hypothetical protein
MERTQMPYDLTAVDEIWIAEWIEFGFREITAYLSRYAAFDDFYRRRQPSSATAS